MDINNHKIIFRVFIFIASIASAIFLPWYISVLFLLASILIYSELETILVAVILDTIYSQGGFFKEHIFLISTSILLIVFFEVKKNLIF